MHRSHTTLLSSPIVVKFLLSSLKLSSLFFVNMLFHVFALQLDLYLG